MTIDDVLSCPSRGTWIEIFALFSISACVRSCPSRGTWIEISVAPNDKIVNQVVPLAGHVD